MGNGLTVILYEDRVAELVGVDVWVKSGSGNETPANSGVSHFIEHLVFGATAKRDAGEMDLEMESLGATLGARTARDWAHFSTTVSSRYLPKALEVLADAVSGAQFREADVESERLVILEEIAKKYTDPMKVCRDYLAADLYGSHPYGMPIEGAAESVRKITRQDILDYYRKHYTPRNIAVVLVGDIDAQQAVAEVGRAFQGLGNLPAPEPAAQEVAPLKGQVTRSYSAPYKNEYLALGFLGPPGANYEDVCATDVLLTYLGFGYRSWMSEGLKGKMALATEVSADFLTQRHPGMISLIAATTEANLPKAREAILARIASIRREGIPQEAIAAAKRSLLGQFAFQNETFGGVANCYGFYYAVSEPEFAVKYVACVQSVTNEDIIRAAQRYLDPDRAVVITVGPSQGGTR